MFFFVRKFINTFSVRQDFLLFHVLVIAPSLRCIGFLLADDEESDVSSVVSDVAAAAAICDASTSTFSI